MRSDDPNFPPEIPPVPPPRDGLGPVFDHRRQPEPSGLGDQPEQPVSSNGVPRPSGEGSIPPAGGEGIGDSQSIPSWNRPPEDSSVDASAPARPDYSNPRPGSEPSSEPEIWTDSDPQASEPPPRPRQPARPDHRTPAPEPRSKKAYSPVRPIQPSKDVWTDADIPYQPKELGVVDQFLLLLAEGITLWRRGLRWVRSQLPPNLQRQLSDEVMTAIALGLLVLFLALWNPLGLGRGARAEAPHDARSPLTALEPSSPAESPSGDEGLTTSAQPPALEEPQAVAPTPEQSLIADIQTRVSTISRSYGAGLIQSVEVNLTGSTLGVNLAETWYGLLTEQQNEIAQDIYNQAQGLNFNTLQLRDPNGVVVARNPVVGTTMVVLHRLRHEQG